MVSRYLSRSQLSDLTGKDRRTISKRLEGLEPHSTDGRADYYDAYKALPMLYASDSARGIDKKLLEEQLRYETARADKVSLEVEKRKGELIPFEDVCALLEKEYSAVKAGLLAIPTKLALQLSTVDQPKEVKRHIEDAINEVLTELTADKQFAEIPHSGEIQNDELGDESLPEPSEDAETEAEA